MKPERLVAMLNDIAAFFAADPDRARAVAGVEDHVRRFWEARMTRDLLAHVRAGGAGLSPLAADAARRLAEAAAAEP